MAQKNHQKRQGKILRVVLITFGLIAAAELIALVLLYVSVASNKKFWIQKAKDPGELTYVALGDSAAQGIGASSPMRGYVGLVANKLENKTGKSVRIVNVSVTGATIGDALRDQLPKIQSIKADIVTIEIGANDIKTFQPEKFEKEFSQLISFLPKGTYVSDMPLFNSRPGSTGPAKEASQIVRKLVNNNPDLYLVELEKVTTNNQSIFGFAPDLFHPNNVSYKHWADAFWQAIESSNRIQ